MSSDSPTRFLVTSSSRRRFLTGALGAAGAASLGRDALAGALSGNDRARYSAQNELSLIIGTLGEASKINPFTESDSEGSWRCSQLYDELLRVDPQSYKPLPGLAKEYKVDGLVITLTLQDAKFSDGSDLTADDIKFTIEGILNPKVASPRQATLASIKGAAEMIAGKANECAGVTAKDPKTVVIELAKPDAAILYNLRNVRPVPMKLLKGKDLANDPFFQKPIGAGPYMFESWSTGGDFVMVANPHFFEAGKPKVNRVTHRVIADAQSLVLALLNNEIDGSNYPAPSGKAKLEENKELVIMVPPFASPNGWMFNTRHELLKKKEVRQAICMGLDREQFAKDALMGLGKAGIGPIAPDSWAYDSALQPLPYDKEKAKQMIKDAGAEGAQIKFAVNAGNTMREDWLVYTQQALQEIGITVTPETIEWATLVSAVTERQEFEVVGGDWMGVMAEPSGLYEQFYTGLRSNYSGYTNPELDKLLDEARATIEPDKAKPIYAKIQAHLVDQCPFYWAWYRPFLHTVNKKFTGYTDSGNEGLFYTLKDWTGA